MSKKWGSYHRVKSDNINSNVPINVIIKFYLGGVINIGLEWLQNNTKYTKEEIVEYLSILIPKTF